ncbi:MAG: thioredoxin [Bacteroidetes bacterium RBG_13_43_22]|nr:MAG: thioredoxin [Bacteroidetes bacterium RBG_13_43_22]OFY82123.1 MAG: thioredoxin [Bacteroidetes bacterium RBG_19FT_COMBO_42_7]
MVNLEKIRGVLLTSLLFVAVSCNSQSKPAAENKEAENKDIKYKVTFIELGSVRCIPCQQMQPIMKSIREKYPTQVNVVFHDVWTEAGAPYAKQYGIDAIPTQVFLDKDGKEYFRHIGFFPEEELVKVLNQKGVK